MAIKLYKPTTPSSRGMTTQDFSEITSKKPLKSLTIRLKKTVGRNNQGRITTRHKGGGKNRRYRLIDFNLADNTEGRVISIEYDPNRSARIALIETGKAKFSYILAPKGLSVGQKITSSSEASIETGNRLALKDMPVGSQIHNVEMSLNSGGQIARSAGVSAQLMGLDGGNAQVRLPSGEIRQINENCRASLGSIGNEQHQNVKIGKAGRNRLKGKRPSVRGVVMNAVDHPHGGGDGGRHGVGGGKDYGSAPRTPWGQKTLGFKTRRRKSTDKYIIRSRHDSKRR